MTLSLFIEEMGPRKIAEILDMTPEAVKTWVTGKAIPRAEEAYKIIQVSNGLLDFNKIYLPWAQKQCKGQTLKVTQIDGKQLELPL